MGSASDLPILRKAMDTLKTLDIPLNATFSPLTAHRKRHGILL